MSKMSKPGEGVGFYKTDKDGREYWVSVDEGGTVTYLDEYAAEEAKKAKDPFYEPGYGRGLWIHSDGVRYFRTFDGKVIPDKNPVLPAPTTVVATDDTTDTVDTQHLTDYRGSGVFSSLLGLIGELGFKLLIHVAIIGFATFLMLNCHDVYGSPTGFWWLGLAIFGMYGIMLIRYALMVAILLGAGVLFLCFLIAVLGAIFPH